MPFLFWLIYPAFQFFGMTTAGPLPSVGTILRDFAVATLVNDTLFYWVHRTMHAIPYLYRNVHSRHHRFVAPIGVAAEYAHPVRFSGLAVDLCCCLHTFPRYRSNLYLLIWFLPYSEWWLWAHTCLLSSSGLLFACGRLLTPIADTFYRGAHLNTCQAS